jgi:hypothetical protein
MYTGIVIITSAIITLPSDRAAYGRTVLVTHRKYLLWCLWVSGPWFYYLYDFRGVEVRLIWRVGLETRGRFQPRTPGRRCGCIN